MRFQPRSNQNRRGVILLVVLALLTLFAVVGISFVLYANAEATAARINKEGETILEPNIDPELALSMFLSQLIYDVPDDANGVYSGLRGHSLARSMYGWNSGGLNDKPYTGTGKLHYPPTTPIPGATGYATDDSYLVNFMYVPTDGFLRDPERYGSRSGLVDTKGNPTSPGTYTGGFNVPYTYPDHQNMFLAMMNAGDGTVKTPSFHRPWLTGTYSTTSTSAWQNTSGKYLTCLVRPADMGTGFPVPDSNGLSVKNLDWGAGGNDSGWIDIGAPVMTASNGQKYKMLFAPLILELDSRINLNVVGNILGNGSAVSVPHASDMGWMGASEINPGKVLDSQTSASPEWPSIFQGSPNTGTARVVGRYGASTRLPQGSPLWFGSAYPRQYSSIDFNALQGASPNALVASSMQLPPPLQTATPLTVPYQCYPSFPSGFYSGTGVAADLSNNPLMYNPLGPTPDNRLLPLSSLVALLRYGGTNSEALSSDLLRLCPQNFVLDAGSPPVVPPRIPPTVKRRNMVTLYSYDLDRPGATPYVWNPNDSTIRYQFNPQRNALTGLWNPLFPLQSTPIAFPDPKVNRSTTPTNPPSEFDPATWRSMLGQQLRVNLNRPLTLYPAPYSQPGSQYSFNISPTTMTSFANNAQYQQALKDRQQLALDIFRALQTAVIGTPLPSFVITGTSLSTGTSFPSNYNSYIDTVFTTYTKTSQEYNALRWLAQLAVNIVDYIDQDDINTPFPWDPKNNPTEFVFGTELPRLVINEAFIQVDNDPTDPGLQLNPPRAQRNYNVNTWVELCNPLPAEPAGSDTAGSPGANQAVLQYTNSGNTVSVYQLVITDPAQTGTSRLVNIRHPANVVGDPSYPNQGPNYGVAAGTYVMSYGGTPGTPCVINASNLDPTTKNPNGWQMAGGNTNQLVVLPPANLSRAYNDPGYPNGTNQGFYVIGSPNSNSLTSTNLGAVGARSTTTSPAMTYWLNVENAPKPGVLPPKPTILLQRLACPCLPFSNDTTSINYNPYITVDYYEAFVPGQVCDSRQYTATLNGATYKNPTPTGGVPNWNPPHQASSWGRRQPYTASNGSVNGAGSWWRPEQPATPQLNQPLTTFYRHNSATEPGFNPNNPLNNTAIDVPFNWLVHLDRPLISPMELLHVSAFKPHEMTQQFHDSTNSGGTAFYSHYAPWTNQDNPWANPSNTAQVFGDQSRLYRFFELIETANRANGVSSGGRIPGKVNINMIFDKEIFRALCDAQPSNWFYYTSAQPDQVVDDLFQVLVQQRTPNGVPGPDDYPFWSLATGVASGGDALDPNTTWNPSATPTARGILNTLLRDSSAPALTSNNPPSPRLILDPFPDPITTVTAPSPGHDYQLYQLLTKIFNNVTTRSNVFAVWLTVGFFEVAKDPTTGLYVGDQFTPVKLGPEIGQAEGRQIRHRMFAIVDRTNLQVFSTTSSAAVTLTQNNFITTGTTYIPAQATVQLTQTSGTLPYGGATWQVQAGSVLVYEPNTPNEETVVVQSGNVAIFQRPHAKGVQVISRGNPGPRLRYDPRTDTQVVPYFAIID